LTISLRRIAPVLLAAGSLLGPLASPARSEEPAAAKGITWVDGFAAGTAAGKKDGHLLFVYVGRHRPT
jgi:hypothetical protein